MRPHTAKRPDPSPSWDTFTHIENGHTVLRPVYALSLFSTAPFPAVRAAMLEAFDIFVALCPEPRLSHYLTATMDKHKAITPRTLPMLRAWLQPEAARRERPYFELMAAGHHEEAPEFRLVVSGYGDRADDETHALRIALPAVWAIEHAQAMADLVRHLARLFPYSSGHAGLALEWSPYYDQEACTVAWQLGMQYPAFDIFDRHNDEDVAGADGLKTVSWLTLLGPALVTELGGDAAIAAHLPAGLAMESVGAGWMLRAGDTPQLSHCSDLAALKPLQDLAAQLTQALERGAQRSFGMEFHPGDVYDNTLRWLRRWHTTAATRTPPSP